MADDHGKAPNLKCNLRIAPGTGTGTFKTASYLDAAERFIVAEGYDGVKLSLGRIFLIISPTVGRNLNNKQGDPR
jgi:hypothetical protein